MEKVPLMSDSGAGSPGGAGCYDFDYDRDSWTPVAVAPIRTKPQPKLHHPARQPISETRIPLQLAAGGLNVHTVLHRPLDGTRRRPHAVLRRLFAVGLFAGFVVAACIAGWFLANNASQLGRSVQCQASALAASMQHAVDGREPSFGGALRSCMGPAFSSSSQQQGAAHEVRFAPPLRRMPG